MKVYLSARYARREELQRYRDHLVAEGFVVTSRWLDGETEDMTENAIKDRDDVLDADVLVAFSDDPVEFSPHPYAARGGRHVEFGIAIGAGMPIVVVGPKENVFHHLGWIGGIKHIGGWASALTELIRLQAFDGPMDRLANVVRSRSSGAASTGSRFSYAVTGLMAEVGELAHLDHAAQRRGAPPVDSLDVLDESGDVLYHLVHGLDAHGWRLRDAVRWISHKLQRRKDLGKDKPGERQDLVHMFGGDR
jgi:NTP pyrophosphatase (non-canonical NTP hydrolase)